MHTCFSAPDAQLPCCLQLKEIRDYQRNALTPGQPPKIEEPEESEEEEEEEEEDDEEAQVSAEEEEGEPPRPGSCQPHQRAWPQNGWAVSGMRSPCPSSCSCT